MPPRVARHPQKAAANLRPLALGAAAPRLSRPCQA